MVFTFISSSCKSLEFCLKCLQSKRRCSGVSYTCPQNRQSANSASLNQKEVRSERTVSSYKPAQFFAPQIAAVDIIRVLHADRLESAPGS